MSRAFIATRHRRLVQLDEQWWLWDGTRYRPIGPKHVEAELWKWLEAVGAFTPTPRIVGDMLKGLASILKLPPGTEMPCWLERGDHPNPERVVAFQNGLLDVTGEEFRLVPHSSD